GAAAPNALTIVTRTSNHLSFIAVHHLRAVGPRPTFIPLAPGPHRLHPNAGAALGTPPRRELTLMRRRRLCLAAARTPTRLPRWGPRAAVWPQARLPGRRLPPRPARRP